MAQRSTHVENFFVVRWGVPEARDCAHIRELIPELHARAGKPLNYFALMPADNPSFDDEQRRLLMDLTEAVLPHCARLIIVIHARGVRGTILRSAMTAVTLLTRRSGTLGVVNTIEAALERVADELPPRAAVLRAIRKVGGELDDARVA